MQSAKHKSLCSSPGTCQAGAGESGSLQRHLESRTGNEHIVGHGVLHGLHSIAEQEVFYQSMSIGPEDQQGIVRDIPEVFLKGPGGHKLPRPDLAVHSPY